MKELRPARDITREIITDGDRRLTEIATLADGTLRTA
jgi:hypothetical protein